ncbi:phosphotransferase [Micromonospora luteifusca]
MFTGVIDWETASPGSRSWDLATSWTAGGRQPSGCPS